MPDIKKTKVTKNASGNYYTATTTIENDPNKTVDTVQLDITNVSGQPDAEPTNYILNYYTEANGLRLFKNTTVYFESNAVGYEYSMTFTMYDKFGNVIPSAVTATIEVEQAMTMP
ncbi:MAG: hypothetical protein AB8E82_04135 [Aureispira sp.]